MRIVSTAVSFALMFAPSPALAWGYEGHEIVATIPRSELTPAVRAKINAILATIPSSTALI